MSILLLIAALTFAGAPLLTPFNGFDPQAYPIPQYDPPVQPSGYAFAIWSVIYSWLIISALIGVTIRKDAAEWRAYRAPLLGSLVLGTLWLAVASASPIFATILIWAMLLLALAALERTPVTDRMYLRAPIGLYAGWLTGASWVSVGLLGAGYGLIFGQLGWAIFCILAALLMSISVMVSLRNVPAYAAGVTWALIAIAIKDAQSTPTVALIAGLGAMIVGGAVLWTSPMVHTSDD